jgi:hypothetical protein
MDMLDFGRDLWDLMRAGVKDRNVIATLEQPVNDEVPGGSSSADD